MTPPEPYPPDDHREWLNRAKSNLAMAKNRVPEVYLEDLCFEAQQAAEKAIKAVMIMHGIEFPYVHDLARLLSLLEEAGKGVPESVMQAEELTQYAMSTRYPSLEQPVLKQTMTKPSGSLRLSSFGLRNVNSAWDYWAASRSCACAILRGKGSGFGSCGREHSRRRLKTCAYQIQVA